MLITTQNLDAMFRGFNTKYRDSYDRAPSFWDKIAMKMPSSGRDETYAWLGLFPNLREWIGPRVVKRLSASSFTILNRKFETTVEVARDAISDDKYAVFGPMFEEMGLASKTHPDELVFAVLAGGFTTNGYDGVPFFGTTHPVVNAAGATVNVSNFGGGVGTAWYLLDTSRAVRPIIFQEREPYELQALTNANTDHHVFSTDNFLYGIRARVAAGLGLWQLAYASRAPLTPANYALARAAMQALTADGGRPLGTKPTVMVVPPSLEAAAMEILNTENGSAGATNIWKGTAELIVTPFLTV